MSVKRNIGLHVKSHFDIAIQTLLLEHQVGFEGLHFISQCLRHCIVTAPVVMPQRHKIGEQLTCALMLPL